MKEGRAIFMANGRPAAEGRCVECGTKLFKIGATADHAGLAKPEVATGGRGNKETRKQGEKETGKQGDKVTRRQGDKEGVSAAKRSSGAASRTAGRTIQPPTSNLQPPTGKLVIVESPAKARTVGRFLGRGYDVRASVGHVRDLLKSRLSVDLEHDFAPTYRVPNEKKEVVKSLKEAAAGAKEIYLATDRKSVV